MKGFGVLRDIKDEELELMRCWRNEPSVRENMYTRHVISSEEHRQWWDRVVKDPTRRYFMYEAASLPLGIVAFTDIDSLNMNASWAFYASPQAPRGTGMKMEFLALDYAFLQENLHKLYCEVLAFNEAVIKLHKKFNFSVEGIFREHHKVGDQFVDIYRLGLMSEEWVEHRPTMQARLNKLNRGS